MERRMEPSCQRIELSGQDKFHYHDGPQARHCSMKELTEGKGGVEWCDQEARSRQCMGHSITGA